MRLSIIIPFHRGKHFLDDCLESLSEQQINDYETILVLDNVKEDIDSLLELYKDKLNIKTVEINKTINQKLYSKHLADENDKSYISKEELDRRGSEYNYSGVAAARNLGIEKSKGDYIFFLDSDDYLHEESLKKMIKVIEDKDNNYDIIYGRIKKTWFSKKVYFTSFNKEDALINEVDQLTLTQLIDYKKTLSDIGIIGMMIKREYLNKYNIKFDENMIFYSELPYLISLINNIESSKYVIDAFYIKRKHNNPIDYPSLSQLMSENKFKEYINAYQIAREISSSEDVKEILDQKLIDFYLDQFTKKIRRSSNELWRTEYFKVMQEAVLSINNQVINNLTGFDKRLVNGLKKGNIKKLKLLININLGFKKLLRIRKNKRLISYYLYFKVFSKKPIIKDLVLCESFYGKSYAGNPKYLYEYLSENYPDKFKFVWIIDKKSQIPFKHKKVKRFSIRYAYYIARSQYYIFNSRQPEWVRKRKGNTFLQTWHGTPLKRLVFDQDEVMAATPLYKAQVYKQSRAWDYLVSANYFSTEVFKKAFKFDNRILEYGYPRNDILHSQDKEERARDIKKKLKIPMDKKTILYAPTWRDDEYYGKGKYKFQLKLDLQLLKEKLGSEYLILLRTHYFIADSLDIKGVEDFAINLSKYDDISELYLISDILITDYSSVFFDYANLKRPMIFYTYDLDKYRDILRGFYFDIEKELPGPIVYTSDEVVNSIINIKEISEEYIDKYELFYEKFCGLEDGCASRNISKEVFNL
ncbi:MAG TPA: bifunctional glycosyltransferase family 2 protein/CDP-glycerol:glycerophosphate glycerophosphotransferase [Clostridiales bacterium]|nr:bifunctional glycosyltransferase family 2 protein/CDP-glycerol:glycerophosphate glycerophosphotransferase [Clostridiales bacterium]